MKNSLLAIGMMILGSSCLPAQDWPQWRGSNRDGKSSGFTAPKTWPKELTQKWKVAVGDGVATPALVGDKLYVFARQDGNEVTRCLEAATGNEIWKDKYETGGATGPASGFSGPRASPTVIDGKVVTLGVKGSLSCLDAAKGSVIWRKDDFKGSVPKFFTSCSPIVVNGLVIVQLGSENSGGIVAYDLATGNEKWKWIGDGTAYASPTLLTLGTDHVVVAETAKKIVGIGAADGKLLWETPFPVAGKRGYNAASPMVDGQTVFYAGSGRGTVAVKMAKKEDSLAGTQLWKNSDNSVQYNTPILKNGFVFGLSDKNVLFCIDAEKGTTAWTHEISGKQGYGSIVDAGIVNFVLTPKAQLIVFESNGKEFKELASYKVSATETYAYPVVSGNRILVKDKDSVILYTIE